MASGGQAVLLGYPDEYMAGDREHHTTNKVKYSTVQYSTVQYREHHTTNKVGARQSAGCCYRDAAGGRPARLAGQPRRGHCGAAVRGVRPGAGAGDPGGGAPRPPAPGLRQDPLPLLLPAAGMLDPARQVTQHPAACYPGATITTDWSPAAGRVSEPRPWTPPPHPHQPQLPAVARLPGPGTGWTARTTGGRGTRTVTESSESSTSRAIIRLCL